MKTTDLRGVMRARGWQRSTKTLKSNDGSMIVTVWRRESVNEFTHNDILLTLEENGEVKLFRQASNHRPMDLILSGKAPPA